MYFYASYDLNMLKHTFANPPVTSWFGTPPFALKSRQWTLIWARGPVPWRLFWRSTMLLTIDVIFFVLLHLTEFPTASCSR